MSLTRKIIWEPVHYYYNDQTGQLEDIKEELEEISFEKDVHEDINSKIYEMLENKSIAFNTPFGIYDVKDALVPTKHFDFWLSHTNFNVDSEVTEKLCKVDGVEVLKIISRYRFILAPGKAFSFSDVRKSIEEVLKIGSKNKLKNEERLSDIDFEMLESVLGDQENINDVIEILKRLNNLKEGWVFYMFPNGNYEFCISSENENFNEKLKEYRKIYEKISGVFYTNVI